MAMNAKSPRPMNRPQFRNIGIGDLVRYRLPLSGVVSILHRISGLLMFLALPFVLYLFELSLSSEKSYRELVKMGQGFVVRLVLLAVGWALLHHLCAGIRFLLLDLHLGAERATARRSSIAVFAASVPLTILLAVFLWGGA